MDRFFITVGLKEEGNLNLYLEKLASQIIPVDRWLPAGSFKVEWVAEPSSMRPPPAVEPAPCPGKGGWIHPYF